MLHSNTLSLWLTLPFIGILLSIALLPLFCHSFWEKNKNKAWVSLLCSLPVLFYFRNDFSHLSHSLEEYFSFMALIGSLFVISGGISIQADLEAKPLTNTLFLALGAVFANFIGTTGASMLLIRPFLKTNRERKNTWHLPLFFIFMVSNIGGCLTPLGDPPLFLGYLNGVPFSWTFSLFPEWLFAISLLLLIFFVWDHRAYSREKPEDLKKDRQFVEPLKIRGVINFFLLGGVVGSIFLPTPLREIIMMALAFLSYFTTKNEIHKQNEFSFSPILEVAILFLGIFITMTPTLEILKTEGSRLHLTEPWQFFWVAGTLSSFLDNAPTYLTFFNLAKGLHEGGGIAGVPELLLKAISLGSVFMGANSYIGNGPNFMVKAIADEQGFKTLSFGAYFLMAMVILFPIYFLITWVFL